ncbi:unnamed protein product [Schistosoma rodhaini]|nr:unnamed protein product [Schistosoma rodhaini]
MNGTTVLFSIVSSGSSTEVISSRVSYLKTGQALGFVEFCKLDILVMGFFYLRSEQQQHLIHIESDHSHFGSVKSFRRSNFFWVTFIDSAVFLCPYIQVDCLKQILKCSRLNSMESF